MSRRKTLLAALIPLLFLSGVIASKVRAGEELLPGPPPTAVVTADPVAVTPGTEVFFGGSHSCDKDIKVGTVKNKMKEYPKCPK